MAGNAEMNDFEYVNFIIGPHYGNKKYRLMRVRKFRSLGSFPMDEIQAIEDGHILDLLEEYLERLKYDRDT